MRPSLAPQRREAMLAALESVIAEHGVAGATMERIAATSGWTRGHVRHYLGNKEDQLRALVDSLATRYASGLRDAVESADAGGRRQVVLETLFGEAWQDGAVKDDVVLDQLVAYETANPGAGGSIRSMYERIADVIADAVAAECPWLGQAEAEDIGYCVVSFAYGTATMAGLGWVRGPVAVAMARRMLLLSDSGGRSAPA